MNYSNEIRENGNKGFSLVELIVVIAIMAVMAAVLAPSLLGYVERSRAQKDDSAMGELTNAIQIALADQSIFDEVLAYTTTDRASCYIDKAAESSCAATSKVFTSAGKTGTTDPYTFSDAERTLDEKKYGFAGKMRGVTITFKDADNDKSIDVAQGIVNGVAAFDGDCAPETTEAKKPGVLGTMNEAGGNVAYAADKLTGKLYNRVRATVGDKINLASQTYRNSEYTVFIRMGTTGGNSATDQEALKVYGQWNGTNLS